jgi:hypothetical protein
MVQPPAQQPVEQVVNIPVAENEEKLYLRHVARLL